MSEAVSDQVVQKMVQARTAFNNIFKTKLEIDAKKLRKQVEEGDEADTGWPWGHDVDDLKELVLKHPDVTKAGIKHIKVREISISYWCSIPASLDKEFVRDVAMQKRLQTRLEAEHKRLVDDLAGKMTFTEQMCEEQSKDAKHIANCQKLFDYEINKLQAEYQASCTALILEEFSGTVKAMGNHTRYKVKAGAKLTITALCVAASAVALGTAATPAAPATLIPAVAGIAMSLMSFTKQIVDLTLTVEQCEHQIHENLQNWEAEYKDAKTDKLKKANYKIAEFAGGAFSGLTGGMSEVVFPTIAGTLDIVERHSRKVDGLVAKLHKYGVRLGNAEEELKEIGQVMQPGKLGWPKDSEQMKKQLQELVADIQQLKTLIPGLEDRIEKGRKLNKQYGDTLKAIEKALGTKHYAEAGQLLASLAVVASGSAGIATALHGTEAVKVMEKVTVTIAMVTAGLDALKDNA
jgi:hypothetical protein